MYENSNAVLASLENAKKAYTYSQSKLIEVDSQYSEYRQEVDEEFSSPINSASSMETIRSTI